MLKGRAMGLLQQPLQKRLSAMLGAEVTFEKLNVSLLGGSVEAHGVKVAGDDPAMPVLTIRRVRAEISLGAALKKEFVVKSLTIENPVLTVVRDAQGRLNLPKRMGPPEMVADTPANKRQTSDNTTDTSATEDLEGTWKLEAKKVLLVDGELHYREASGFHAACGPILAELKEGAGGMEFTLIGESAGRRDELGSLGQIRLHGTAKNVSTLTDWSRAAIRASVELGETLRGQVHVPSLDPLEANVELSGSADIKQLLALFPVTLKAVAAVRALNPSGRVELNARATYQKADGLRVPELTLRAADVVLPKSPA